MSFKCVVGDLVTFEYGQYQGEGVVQFVGSLLPTKTGLWVGIDQTSDQRKSNLILPEGHNGKLDDMQYFQCSRNRGIFVPYENVEVSNPKEPSQEKKQLMNSMKYEPGLFDGTLDMDCSSLSVHDRLQQTEQLLRKTLSMLQSQVQGQDRSASTTDRSKINQHYESTLRFLNAPSITTADEENEQEMDPETEDEKSECTVLSEVKYQKKHAVYQFLKRYSDHSKWRKVGKERYGVEAYRFKMGKHKPVELRMSFLYSMMLYLVQITGANKRCISHGAILVMVQQHQIETLAADCALVLDTLKHHNSDRLWIYVHDYLDGVFANFRIVSKYSGKRVVIQDKAERGNVTRGGTRGGRETPGGMNDEYLVSLFKDKVNSASSSNLIVGADDNGNPQSAVTTFDLL